jgi:hypothetical protein
MEAILGSNNPDFNKLFTDTVGIIEQMRVAAQRHGFERMYITMGTHEDVSPGDYYIVMGAQRDTETGYKTWEAEIIGKNRLKATINFSEREYRRGNNG